MERIGAEQQPRRAAKTSGLSLLGLSSSQPRNNDTNALELNESDVIWSFSGDDDYVAVEESTSSISSTSAISTASDSPTTGYGLDRRFGGEMVRYGLSAVLAEENSPLVRRKASPSIGTSAVGVGMRTMIPRSRKGSPSSGDGSIGYGSGRFNMSAPVNIPVWGKMREGRMRRFEEEGDEEEEEVVDGDKEMLPPHEVVAARSQMMTFSVFEGVGRTLKGRDLRRVRNAVFQQTGFLD